MTRHERYLFRAQLADLKTDIRCAYRDGLNDYAMKTEREYINLSTGPVVMDRYGWFSPEEVSDEPINCD